MSGLLRTVQCDYTWLLFWNVYHYGKEYWFIRLLIIVHPPTYKLALLATVQLSLVTTFPTATDNCEGQMMFLKLHSMLLLLGALAVTEESIKIKFYYGGDSRNCRKSEVPQTISLRSSRLYTVFFDKKTKLISYIKRWRQHVKSVLGGIGTVEYKWNVTENFAFGMYFSFIRTANLRRNQNLISNYVHNYERLHDELDLVPPSIGSDFFEMYHEAPSMLRIHLFKVKETGEETEIKLYRVDKCAEDQRWVANEGYYRLDIDTGQLLPTYYDPLQSDFYY
nr:unnamed protein product [Haemonchus contortus]